MIIKLIIMSNYDERNCAVKGHRLVPCECLRVSVCLFFMSLHLCLCVYFRQDVCGLSVCTYLCLYVSMCMLVHSDSPTHFIVMAIINSFNVILLLYHFRFVSLEFAATFLGRK